MNASKKYKNRGEIPSFFIHGNQKKPCKTGLNFCYRLVVEFDLDSRNSAILSIFDDALDLKVVVEGASLIDGELHLVTLPSGRGLGLVPKVSSTWHEGLGPSGLRSKVETLTLFEEGAVISSEVWSVRPVLFDIGAIH